MKRSGPLKRSRRRKPERRVPFIWRLNLGPCEVCPAEGGTCAGPVQGHHVVSQQKLKKVGLTDRLWDLRNRLPVCGRRHEQHTTRAKPIPLALLPQAALDFAEEFELTYWIERQYPC